MSDFYSDGHRTMQDKFDTRRLVGDNGGARDGSLTPSRYRRTETGSVSAATIFSRPPHAGHSVTSTCTRASSLAHDTRWHRGLPGAVSAAAQPAAFVSSAGTESSQNHPTLRED